MADNQYQPLFQWHQYPLEPDRAVDIGCQAQTGIPASYKAVLWSLGADLHQLELLAEACFVAIRWPDGIRCPQSDCGSSNVQEVANCKPMPYRCRKCRKHFSNTSGTWLGSTKLDHLQLLGACYLTVGHWEEVTARQLAECLQSDVKTARKLRKLFREAISDAHFSPFAAAQSAADGVDPLVLTGAALAVVLRDKDRNAGQEAVFGMAPDRANSDPADGDGEKAPFKALEPYWFEFFPCLRNPEIGTENEPQEPIRAPTDELAPRRTDQKEKVAAGRTAKPTNGSGQEPDPSHIQTAVCSQPRLPEAGQRRFWEPEPATLVGMASEKAVKAPAVTARKRKPRRAQRRIGGPYTEQLRLWLS
ncbi:MAG: IS1 family transposase [Chloroflexi bacterium]|nr:IS1 family transposase [Chloroflexota bacterium]MYD47040.1 IS1 family transposase [Chloroflexota bacterium]